MYISKKVVQLRDPLKECLKNHKKHIEMQTSHVKILANKLHRITHKTLLLCEIELSSLSTTPEPVGLFNLKYKSSQPWSAKEF